MAATKKYYYEDLLLGSSTTSLVGSKNKAYCQMDTAVVVLEGLLNEWNGGVMADMSVLEDYQLVPCDIISVAINAITAVTVLSGTTTTRMSNTHLVEGDVVRLLFRIRNPFKYPITQKATYLYTGYTSVVESHKVALLTSNYGCNANSETSIRTGNTFTISAPEKNSGNRVDTMWFGLNILENDPEGELQCSGCTDIGKKLPMVSVLYNNASATTYGKDAALLSKPVLALPYVKIVRASGSGNVNSGATVNMYVRVYNPNGYNMTNAVIRIEVTGTGFSDSVGQISWNSNNSYGSVISKTGITVNLTSAANYQSNDTYKQYSFYYKAPSSTTQGTATISGTITGSTIDGRTGIKGPSRGNGQIVVNATAPANPQYYYYPFRAYDIDGNQITSSSIVWNIATLSTKSGGECACWDDGGGWCGGACSGTFTFGSVLNGSSDRVYYARVATSVTTTYFDNLSLTEFYDGGTYEAYNDYIHRTSGSTYAAFSSAGIADLYFGQEVVEEPFVIYIDTYDNGIKFADGPISPGFSDEVDYITVRLSNGASETFEYSASDGFLPVTNGLNISGFTSASTTYVTELVLHQSDGQGGYENYDFVGSGGEAVCTWLLGIPSAFMMGDFERASGKQWYDDIVCWGSYEPVYEEAPIEDEPTG